MKRVIPIFLALLLLAACGDKAAPSSSQKDPSSGGGLVISPPEDGPGGSDPDEGPEAPGEDDSIPQADVALVREIVFAYGAQEDTLNQPGTIIVRKKSLFFRSESWSGENGLAPDDYLYWVDSLPQTVEEWDANQADQHYAEGRPAIGGFSSFYLGPGDVVEEKILAHFEVTLEHLRGDPDYYDASIPGYFLPAGGGMGIPDTVSFTFQQDGEILTIPVTLTSNDGSGEESVHTLTVRLEPGGGWKFLGCQVA